MEKILRCVRWGYEVNASSDDCMDAVDSYSTDWLVWCQLLLKTGQFSTAREVIRKRIKAREGAPFTWRLLEKSYAMEGNAEAGSAGERAKMLESSYF